MPPAPAPPAPEAPAPSPPFAPVRDRLPALGACLVSGAMAAVLGLSLCTLLVLALWISSPYPDSGPGGALRTAAALWLLAHGADLLRTDTLTGLATPIGVTPLLLVALPVWLVHRAARDAARPGAVPLVWSGVVAGYLAVALAAAGYTAGGALRPAWASTCGWVPALVGLAAAAGIRTAYGRPRRSWPPRRPAWAARLPLLRGDAHGTALRRRTRSAAVDGAVGALALVGGGALLVGVSLLWHGDEVRAAFPGLTEGWSGQFTVLLLALVLVPNAAVWGAGYALGPGFHLGSSWPPIGPFTAGSADPSLPPFPLFAAVPGPIDGAGWLRWTVLVVPLAAGAAIAWSATRAGDGGWRCAVRTLEGALWCGAAVGVLALLSGGPLGVADLGRVGPVGWRVAVAAVAWTAPVAFLLALLLALLGWLGFLGALGRARRPRG
ncbi:DUF6350 family protein [Streptomyces sp. NPDC002490]|uniref:cell division protein PerM n=1 Tax=Streptomyces sp. NPDC002490 TaxID=3154416 RepID=UPI0033173BEF